MARPPPARGAGRPGLHAGGARPSCSRSSVTRSSPDRCCRRCWSPPPWPACPAGRRPCRRSGSAAWPTAPSRRRWRWARRPTRGSRRRTGRSPSRRRCARCSGLPTARLVLVPLDYGTGTGWLLLDREALGDAVSVEALPALDGTRAVGQLTIAGRRGHGAAPRAGHGVRRRRARPGPDAGRGRERGDRPLVPGHGVGVRQGARPVRPAHRPVPGGQARAGRHARRGRAVRRGGLGRRGRLERG